MHLFILLGHGWTGVLGVGKEITVTLTEATEACNLVITRPMVNQTNMLPTE